MLAKKFLRNDMKTLFRAFTESFNKETHLLKLKAAKDFKDIVEKSDVPVMVDFYADWCGPCKRLTPILEKKLDEKKNFKLLKVNVDEHGELAEEHGVSGIPHVVLFKKGKKESSFVGADEKSLADMINLI
jgi:thioredoxin 1